MSLTGKKIAILGGTGTLGQAFAKMTMEKQNPRSIVIFSRDEHKQAAMRSKYPDLDYFVGDIRDVGRLNRALYACDVVIHGAALKRVETGEYDPQEVVKTNVMGSMNVIDAAIHNEVPVVVGISSDKAVDPTTLYGATKMTMERLFLAANSYNVGGAPKFTIAAYGNILGSNGSVIPIFLKQKKEGKPITITHPDMTRFCMRIEEAVELIWSAIEKPVGVHAPVLPSMRIMDMARVIAPEAEIKIIGMKQNEKLHEVMPSVDGVIYSSDKPARWYSESDLKLFLDENYPGWN